MPRIAYVNGRYCDLRDARVNIEDRGYQFADGVYEVFEVRGGRLVDLPRHLARLQRSLGELRIAMPMGIDALTMVLRETIRRNRINYGIAYLQVTRGVARRDHGFPVGVRPALVVTARPLDLAKNTALAEQGVGVITTPENRWPRVDIKSTSLLPNVLAKQAAREQGASEAWFVDADGYVSEGASSNAWIATSDGRLVTRAADGRILAGITRASLKDVLTGLQMALEERPFKPDEALQATEAFLTSATQLVMPVVRIDGKPVGNGRPGPVARRLREQFHRFSHFS